MTKEKKESWQSQFKDLWHFDFDTPMPIYIRWIEWCWHRPIYVGLPLVFMFIPIMCVEVAGLIVYALVKWGK